MGESKRRKAAGGTGAAASPAIRRLLDAAARALRAGSQGEAKAALDEAVRLAPDNAEAWQALGKLALDAGADEAAANILARAVALAPERHPARALYARALQRRDRVQEAVGQMRAACSLQADNPDYWEGLGILEQAIGNTAAAAEGYRRALALRPSLGLEAKLATLISPIIVSRAAMLAEREAMAAAIDRLLTAPMPAERLDDPLRAALWTNFYLAYHGLNNHGLQVKTAAAYRRLCPSLDHVAAHSQRPRPTGGRLRVGLISRFFHDHSIGKTSLGLFQKLSRRDFEVTAILVAPVVDDSYSRAIRQHAEHCLVVPQDLPAARQMIGDLGLDILFYQDIGMEPFTYFLAYSRLAPVQCVSFGHPDTTGLPTMDYFVSNTLYETTGAAAHYSEKLYLLRDLGSLAYYHRPELPEPLKPRAAFGFGDDEHLYICPQNLFKFHPDMDDLIAGILRRDPRGRVVLVAGRIAHWTALLQQRWQESMPDVADRAVFLPRMNRLDYINLIAISHVMLDTVHFNGMNTSLEALSVATPVVTLPGQLQRSRHTQAMYRKMDFEECIVGDPEGYIDLAVRLGTDPELRARVAGEIRRRSGVLFEDEGVVREFERFFRDVAPAVPPA